MKTKAVTVSNLTEAGELRRMLAARVRLHVQEQRRWLFWRVFTITGPAETIDAALREYEQWRDDIDADARTW